MAIFETADSLGSASKGDIAQYLTEIGDLDTAQEYIEAQVGGQGIFLPDKAWELTASTYGYIPTAQAGGNGLINVLDASSIQPDTSLNGQTLKITLDAFYAHEYPGNGTHNVLFDFGAKSQTQAGPIDLRHPLNLKVNDQSHANVAGTAIFLGLKVDANGVAFEGRTINVRSDNDEKIITTFESNAFKTGLALVTTAQPVLKPYSALAIAAISAIATRSKNKQVHSFDLGLDFTNNATSRKLRLGSYLVIQSDGNLNVTNYRWNQATGRLEHFSGPNTPIEFNYIVIGVASFQVVP